MENTSKVLLVSAAILISVILITAGIKIIGSVSSTTKTVDEFGKSLSNASEDATYIFNGQKIIRCSDQNVNNPVNLYYTEFATKIHLNYDYEYTVSFDYEIMENPNNRKIGCGIGFNNADTNYGIYNKDIIYCEYYNNFKEGAKGKFEFNFKLSDYHRNDKNGAADYYDKINNKRKCIHCYQTSKN